MAGNTAAGLRDFGGFRWAASAAISRPGRGGLFHGLVDQPGFPAAHQVPQDQARNRIIVYGKSPPPGWYAGDRVDRHRNRQPRPREGDRHLRCRRPARSPRRRAPRRDGGVGPCLLGGQASAPGESRIAPTRRSCILVAYVAVAGKRLGYICVRRVRLRSSLSWTFPPQNSRGAASAASFVLGPVAISLPPLIRWLAGATPPLNWWGWRRIIAQFGNSHTPP